MYKEAEPVKSSTNIIFMNNLTYNLLPDLIEIQRSSFRWFLEEGLIEELNSFSPITDYTGKFELHFMGENYRLKEPKYSMEEAKRRYVEASRP